MREITKDNYLEELFIKDVRGSLGDEEPVTPNGVILKKSGESLILSSDITDFTDATSVVLNSFDSISEKMFQNNTSLISIDAPDVISIGKDAFSGCTELSVVNLPSVVTTGNDVFENCANLSSVEMPSLQTAGGFMFYNCTNLVSVSLPSLTTITGSSFFKGCTSLTDVNLPSLTGFATTGCGSAFANCSSLVSVTLPKLTMISTGAFSYCSALKTIDLPSLTHIYAGNILKGCDQLEALIMRSATVVELERQFGTTSQPYPPETAYIYVPADLVDSYKTHNTWNTVSDRFRAIEDYPDICG